MANPITWRNINAPNFSDSNRLSIQSGEQINNGLDRLAQAATDYRQGEIDTQNQIKDINTRDFLSRINGFNNLDGFSNFQQRLNTELSNLNPAQVDVLKVQSALDGRDDTLRNDLTQQQTFQANQDRLAAEPYVNQVESLIAKKDYDGASKLLNDTDLIKNKSKYLTAIETSRDADREEKYLLDERTRKIDIRDQEEKGAALLQEVLPSIEDPNLVDKTVRQKLKEIGVTNGKVVSNILTKARPTYQELTRLSPIAEQQLIDMESSNARSLENFDRQTEALLANRPVLPEDAKAFSDLSGSVSNAIDSLVDSTQGDIGVLELFDRSTGDTRNPQNARKKANAAIKNVTNELIGGKNAELYKGILQGPEGDGFMASAIEHAKGRLEYGPSNGWEQDELESELKKAITFGLKFVEKNEVTQKLRNDRVTQRNKLSENYAKTMERAKLAARQERLGSL